MKIKQTFGTLALVLTAFSLTSQAQTTPTGAATSTTYPQGAVVSDSMPSEKASRSQQRAARRNRSLNRKAGDATTTNSTQDARYRQSSSSNGTSINNSNSTNYNSNNVTNAPTGVGSNTATTSSPKNPPK